MKPFSLKFMHFDIQHNTLQIKHKKNYFFFLFYNNQYAWKMNQKSVFFSSSPHRWMYFLLHLKYSINCKSCRNMNNIITYCALNQMLNTIFDIKRIPCRANYTRYWLQKGICAWLMWSHRGACTIISRKI